MAEKINLDNNIEQYSKQLIESETSLKNNSFSTNLNIKEKSKKKKKNKNKCDLDDCLEKKSIIIGKCKWCNLHFCNIHRLPESHICIGINNCKKYAYSINETNLYNQKTITKKVIDI